MPLILPFLCSTIWPWYCHKPRWFQPVWLPAWWHHSRWSCLVGVQEFLWLRPEYYWCLFSPSQWSLMNLQPNRRARKSKKVKNVHCRLHSSFISFWSDAMCARSALQMANILILELTSDRLHICCPDLERFLYVHHSKRHIYLNMLTLSMVITPYAKP